MNKLASKIKQDNTTQMVLVNRDNRQDNFGGLSSLLSTPIKANCIASSTGVFTGSVTGIDKGLDWYSVLYY